PLDGGLDRVGAETGGGKLGERALKGADRRAGVGNDGDTSHGIPPERTFDAALDEARMRHDTALRTRRSAEPSGYRKPGPRSTARLAPASVRGTMFRGRKDPMAGRTIRLAWQRWRAADLDPLAAMLAYYAVLAFAPMMVVLLFAA